MTPQKPPRVATWLLKRFLYGRHKESLIGDLMQLHQEGRSSRWYWRQALASILAGSVVAARAHGTSLMVALVVAWAPILTWREMNALFIHNSGELYWFLRESLNGSEAALDARNGVLVLVWFVGALVRVVCFSVSGWIVGRLHPRHRRLAVAALIATVFVWPVPWEQIRVIEAELLPLIHYGSAVMGILMGGWLANVRGQEKKVAQT